MYMVIMAAISEIVVMDIKEYMKCPVDDLVPHITHMICILSLSVSVYDALLQ